MAWSYFCDTESITLTAETKEELAQKMMQHMKDNHGQDITMEQAMDMINKSGQQAA